MYRRYFYSGVQYLSVCLVVVSFGRAGYRAFADSFWHDEAWVALSILEPTVREMLNYSDPPQITPFFYLLTSRLFVSILGEYEIVFRAPSLIALGISYFLLFRFVSIFWGRKLYGYYSLILFSLSHFPVRYGAELKPYSFAVLVSLLALNIFGLYSKPLFLKNDGLIKNGSIKTAIVIFLFTVFAFFMSYTSLLLVFSLIGLRSFQAIAEKNSRAAGFILGLILSIMTVLCLYILLVSGRAGSDSMLGYWQYAYPPESGVSSILIFFYESVFRLFRYYFFSFEFFSAFIVFIGTLWLVRKKTVIGIAIPGIPLFILFLSVLRYFPGDLGNRVTLFYYPLLLVAFLTFIPAFAKTLLWFRSKKIQGMTRRVSVQYFLELIALILLSSVLAVSYVRGQPYGYDYEPMKDYYGRMQENITSDDQIWVYNNSRFAWEFYNRHLSYSPKIISETSVPNPPINRNVWVFITRPLFHEESGMWFDQYFEKNRLKTCHLKQKWEQQRGAIKNGTLLLFTCDR